VTKPLKTKRLKNAERIFDALCAAPYGLKMPELIDKVYGDRPDGGPEWAVTCIQVTVMNFNRRAKKNGRRLRIYNSSRRGSTGYRYQIWIV